MMRAWVVAIAFGASLAIVAAPLIAGAESAPQRQTSPIPTPIPASQGWQEVQGGGLQSGGGGALIEPIPPPTIAPARSDPAPAATNTTGAPPPAPPPGCPQALASIAPNGNATLYPTFTRNATGGYDGHDATFGYDVRNAIPPGGGPPQTAPGRTLATVDNIAGRVIAVDFSAVGVVPQNGYTGPPPAAPLVHNCDGGQITYGFSLPYLDGDSRPPPPPIPVLDAAPFGSGAALAASVMHTWHIGTVGTLPGPAPTMRTFVHIPTCAWLDSDVPTAPAQLHAIKTAQYDGYTFFLIYTVTVTPGSVSWDWGDGTQTTSSDTPEQAPPALPAYDATTQSWTNPCTVSHTYATVSQGRTITATQSFTTTISVSWSDGVGPNTAPVPCDPGGGPCTLQVGPAQGWQSGPHPVDQIEPIPFNPSAAT